MPRRPFNPLIRQRRLSVGEGGGSLIASPSSTVGGNPDEDARLAPPRRADAAPRHLRRRRLVGPQTRIDYSKIKNDLAPPSPPLGARPRNPNRRRRLSLGPPPRRASTPGSRSTASGSSAATRTSPTRPGTATTTHASTTGSRTNATRPRGGSPVTPSRRAPPQPELTIAIYYKYLGRDA